MQINFLSKDDFFAVIRGNKAGFLHRIRKPEAFIVKQYYSKEFVKNLRDVTFQWGKSSTPSWHRFDDDCPDYHRLHDNYPKAHVKQKFHAFYRHKFTGNSTDLFQCMNDVFGLKNYLAGFSEDDFLNNIPSEGILPRINVHHYPIGGGYQAEHIDPDGPFAQIQTLIVASQHGIDYSDGGLFARSEVNGEKYYLDQYTEPGDMIVISPGIPHGVDPVDQNRPYSPEDNSGRWMILPLFLYSDYPHKDNVKPREVSADE